VVVWHSSIYFLRRLSYLFGAMLTVKGPVNDVLLIEMPKLLSCYWFSRSRSVCVCCTDFPHASRNASWWWCLCFQQETLMLVVVLLFQLQLLPGMMSHAPKICCNECFVLIVCLSGQLVQVLKSVADCFNLQR